MKQWGLTFISSKVEPQKAAMQGLLKRVVSPWSYRIVLMAPLLSNWMCTWSKAVVGKTGLPWPKNCSRW